MNDYMAKDIGEIDFNNASEEELWKIRQAGIKRGMPHIVDLAYNYLTINELKEKSKYLDVTKEELEADILDLQHNHTVINIARIPDEPTRIFLSFPGDISLDEENGTKMDMGSIYNGMYEAMQSYGNVKTTLRYTQKQVEKAQGDIKRICKNYSIEPKEPLEFDLKLTLQYAIWDDRNTKAYEMRDMDGKAILNQGKQVYEYEKYRIHDSGNVVGELYQRLYGIPFVAVGRQDQIKYMKRRLSKLFLERVIERARPLPLIFQGQKPNAMEDPRLKFFRYNLNAKRFLAQILYDPKRKYIRDYMQTEESRDFLNPFVIPLAKLPFKAYNAKGIPVKIRENYSKTILKDNGYQLEQGINKNE